MQMEISRGRKALFEASGFCNHDKVVSGATLCQLFSIFVSSPPSVQEMKFPNYVDRRMSGSPSMLHQGG